MAQPKDIPKEKNIIRIDTKNSTGRSGGTHGWQVKFQLNEKEISKLFSDSKYGGLKQAFDEAISFRDSFSVDWHAVISDNNASRNAADEKNIIGVNFVKGKKKATSDEYSSYWHASWTDSNGKKQFKNFFIATYGNDKAYELAVQARLKAKGETLHSTVSFNIPEDPSVKLWRYLDFTKFVSMLDKKALFFVFSDSLNDPFEGSISAINKSLRPSLFQKKFFDSNIDRSILRSRVAINSWHMNSQESAAMWKLYAQTNEAVCIQSTYSLLRYELAPLFKISKMNYVDYNSEYIPEYHPLLPFIFKRKSFEHEQELRALIDMDEAAPDLHEFMGIEPSQSGIYKSVSIKTLVQRVFVAPDSPDWFYDLVKNVCNSYDLGNISVVRSSLETEPFY